MIIKNWSTFFKRIGQNISQGLYSPKNANSNSSAKIGIMKSAENTGYKSGGYYGDPPPDYIKPAFPYKPRRQ